MTDALVFGIGLRLLAIVQLIAFCSLHRDILGFAGAAGIHPVKDVLAAYRRDFGWRRFVYAPSLLHFASSDRALRGWIWIGAAASCVAFMGGPATPFAFFIAWFVYLSYDVAIDLLYPWDAMLCELSLLAVFAPALALLPSLEASQAPHPVLVWAVRFLAFRVVFGFGKYKFFGPGKLDSGYLKSFLVTQPMPRALGLKIQRWPLWLHQAALLGLFVVEVLCPWLWLGPNELRFIPTIAIIALMIAIQFTGNFGFFNILMIATAVLAMTPSTSAFDIASDRSAFAFDSPHLLGAALLFLGLCHLPFNSWIARSWMYWPDLARVAGGTLEPLLRCIRALAPFRLVHAYGVFGPERGPPGQWIPLFEASVDGVDWKAYRYRFYPTDSRFRGISISPLFPRFDHSLIYEAMGLGLGNLMGSLVGGGHPYAATRALFLERVQRRLLEGSRDVLKLFGESPFGESAPKYVRVSFRFHLLDEHAESPSFTTLDLGEHLPARTRLSAEPIECPAPHGFLPDDRIWTERAKSHETIEHTLAKLDRALQGGNPRVLEDAIFAGAWLVRSRSTPHTGEGEFELFLRTLTIASRGSAAIQNTLTHGIDRDDSAQEGLSVLARLRPTWIAFHARKARLREVTLRGAARTPPTFAPGILRWLDQLSKLDSQTAPLPRFEKRDARGFTLTAPLVERVVRDPSNIQSDGVAPEHIVLGAAVRACPSPSPPERTKS
jgi:hypothetical protein